jgi:hypothetical protein
MVAAADRAVGLGHLHHIRDARAAPSVRAPYTSVPFIEQLSSQEHPRILTRFADSPNGDSMDRAG